MSNFDAYVISVKPDIIENEMSHSHRSIKYKLRRDHVMSNLIPSFSEICEVKIFDAVTPDDFKSEGDKIYYCNYILKRGIDKNYGIYSDDFQVSLSLGYYSILKKHSNENILLLEDDAVLPKDNIKNIKDSIDEFLKIEEPAMLYLQSECPWMKGFPIRRFPNEFLINYNEYLNKIRFDWYDIAGTTCFMLNKNGIVSMLETIDKYGIKNADQLTTIAMNTKKINVYMPKNNENMVLLNKKLQ